MVAALTLGDTSGLGDEDWQAFRLTGTTHLVAISGFNVAIVAGVVFWLVGGCWRRLPTLCLRLPAPRAALIAAVLAAVGYALLAGFEPPVQRAALMLIVLALAGGWGGVGDPARALALAWGLIVALDPLTLLAPGLWLSFSAVAAIYYATAGRLGPLPAWQAALRIQLMLGVLLAPLTLYGFQGTSLTGPLINLVAVPVAAVLTPALLGALLLSSLIPALGLPLLGWTADALAAAHRGLLCGSPRTPLMPGPPPVRSRPRCCWPCSAASPCSHPPDCRCAVSGSSRCAGCCCQCRARWSRASGWWCSMSGRDLRCWCRPAITRCSTTPGRPIPVASMPAARWWCRCCCAAACAVSTG